MTKLISQPDFQLGVDKLIDTANGQKWTKLMSQISEDEISSFFEEKNLDHGLVENALHPVKDFYMKYPDNVRLFLNEETLYGDLRARAG